MCCVPKEDLTETKGINSFEDMEVLGAADRDDALKELHASETAWNVPSDASALRVEVDHHPVEFEFGLF